MKKGYHPTSFFVTMLKDAESSRLVIDLLIIDCSSGSSSRLFSKFLLLNYIIIVVARGSRHHQLLY